MKRIVQYLILALALVFVQVSCVTTSTPPVEVVTESQELLEKLQAIPEVAEVNILTTSDHFKEHYEIWFEQKIDPSKEDSPTFKQRVLLAHASNDAPVIVELQGYEIHSPRSGELAAMYKGNQLTIEHRFFANSKPKGDMPWFDLTVENAAYDQHKIIQAIKKAIYPENKYISTGISKGGQTTMLHRSFYPKDVDISVCYVAPLNFEREDPRIYHFFDTIGTASERKQIEYFQIACFEKKAEMIKLLEKKAEQMTYSWDVSTEKALELYILEYPFAFWQWGSVKFSQIPGANASADAMLNHVLKVSGVSFFESKGVEKLRPFFWAALTEMGIYGYEYKPFEKYLSQQEDYDFRFTFPEGKGRKFNPAPMKKLNDFIQFQGSKMMFIYGEKDTWSATAVQLGEKAKKNGLRKFVLKDGHHGTRIRHFDAETKKQITNTLDAWMTENPTGPKSTIKH